MMTSLLPILSVFWTGTDQERAGNDPVIAKNYRKGHFINVLVKVAKTVQYGPVIQEVHFMV